MFVDVNNKRCERTSGLKYHNKFVALYSEHIRYVTKRCSAIKLFVNCKYRIHNYYRLFYTNNTVIHTGCNTVFPKVCTEIILLCTGFLISSKNIF